MPKEKDTGKIALVFEATLKLVLKSGFVGLKMAEVAKEAGLATGTLYVYFKNKEDLIDELYFYVKSGIIQEMNAGLDNSASFYINFKKIWTHYFLLCYRTPEKMLFVEQFCYSGFIQQSTKTKVNELLGTAILLMEQAKAQQLIQPLPIPILFGQINGAIHEIVKYHLDYKIKVGAAEMESYFLMAWNSIRK